MTPAPAGIRHRRHATGAMPAALAALALLAGACTISSESPDATALQSRSGPSSGTTTTAPAGEGAAPPDEPGESPQAGDGDDRGTGGESPAPPDAGPEVAGSAGEDAGGRPAGATGESAAPPDTAAEPADTAIAPADTAAPSDTAAGSADGVTGTDPGPAAGETADTAPEQAVPASSAGGAFDERSKVSTVGIDAVYFGMSPEEAAERVGAVWAGVPAGGSDCYVVTPSDGPPGVALWVYHGTVERVDIDTPLLRTQSGLGVGTHLNELRSRLGDKLVVEDHPYLAGWTLATFVPTDPNDAAFRIAFDVSGGEVIRFRAGRTGIVALESCA